VEVWEALVTFGLFFVFIGLAFGADKWADIQRKKEDEEAGKEPEKSTLMNVDFNAIELYRELVREKQGEKATNEAE